MNKNQRLRVSALNDLQRFCPDTHYWLREHSPQADLELSNIVLANPGSLMPTLRELDAAQALSYFAQFELRSRAIWDKINPVMDATAPRLEPSEEEERAREDGEREIAARLEIFRNAALTYARTVGDPQLIEGFQPLPAHVAQATMVADAAPKAERQDAAILGWLRKNGYNPTALPDRPSGKAGVKALVLEDAIKDRKLFSEKSFDIAWARLRKDKKIIGGE